MRLLILLFLLSTVTYAQKPAPRLNSVALEYRHIQPQKTYNQQLNKIIQHKNEMANSKVSIDSVKNYFLHEFEYSIFPYWVGTIWDYDGYTNRPGEDKLIACGYFVSTPLKHMGFNWNRYKLAQMYSKNIAETLCEDVTKYTDKEAMITEINKRDNHLYIVGLDSHVGMILKSDSGTWFVHSNYYGLEGPDKENALMSEALDVSDSYYLGTFSSDENMQNWLDNTLFVTE